MHNMVTIQECLVLLSPHTTKACASCNASGIQRFGERQQILSLKAVAPLGYIVSRFSPLKPDQHVFKLLSRAICILGGSFKRDSARLVSCGNWPHTKCLMPSVSPSLFAPVQKPTSTILQSQLTVGLQMRRCMIQRASCSSYPSSVQPQLLAAVLPSAPISRADTHQVV